MGIKKYIVAIGLLVFATSLYGQTTSVCSDYTVIFNTDDIDKASVVSILKKHNYQDCMPKTHEEVVGFSNAFAKIITKIQFEVEDGNVSNVELIPHLRKISDGEFSEVLLIILNYLLIKDISLLEDVIINNREYISNIRSIISGISSEMGGSNQVCELFRDVQTTVNQYKFKDHEIEKKFHEGIEYTKTFIKCESKI